MRFFRPWFIARWLYPDALFWIKTNDRICCLTFDDGPHPQSTPGLLDLLDKFNVSAVFFCTGRAAERYPGLMDEIRNRGHQIGNHGFDHPDGWKLSSGKFLDDVNAAAELTSDKFFRPPYGHLTCKQYRLLRKSYRIIFWDVMPYDFDRSFDPALAIEVLRRKLRPGSVIVLHDTPGLSLDITRRFLEYAGSEGYTHILLS